MPLATAASSQTPTLRVQINQIDHTVSLPGVLDNSSLPRVPVIRIYGDSSLGQKACLHIHQVYPYFFVEYTEELNPDYVNQYIARLTRSLNHAIAISLKRKPQSSNSRFIRAVLLVKGVHFYGFHSSYSPFLKILVADPALVSRTVTILQSGTIMQEKFRVFESHLSYTLQFMSDFGLYGCGWIDLGEVWKRGSDEDDQDTQGVGTISIAQAEERFLTFKLSPYFRQSRLPLEVDAAAHQVLNRHLLTARNIHHKLEIPAQPLPSEPLVLGVRELWEDERKRRHERGLHPSPDIPVDPSEKSRGSGGEWMAEARWWEEVRQRIEREGKRGAAVSDGVGIWEKWLMTTFESTEALWEAEWKTWRPTLTENEGRDREISDVYDPTENPFASAGDSSTEAPSEDLDIDAAILSSQEMSQLFEQEEHDWADMMGDNDPKPLNEEHEIEDEDLPEDVPPEVQTVDSDNDHNSESTPDPFLQESVDEKFDASSNFTLPEILDSAPIVPINEPITPTRTRTRSGRKSIPHSPPSESIEYLGSSGNETQNENIIAESQVSLSDDSGSGQIRPKKRRKFSDVNDDHTARSPPSSLFLNSSSRRVTLRPANTLTQLFISRKANSYLYAPAPPTTSYLLATTDDYNIPSRVYRHAHYSKYSDAPENPKEFAGLVFNLKFGDGLGALEPWDNRPTPGKGVEDGPNTNVTVLDCYGIGGWEYATSPPSVKETKKWLQSDLGRLCAERIRLQSQIEGPTQANVYGLKNTPGAQIDGSVREQQKMTILSLEVFAPSRDDRVPNANVDEIAALFYAFQGPDDNLVNATYQTGKIVIANAQLDSRRLRDCTMDIVSTELEILNRIVDIVLDLDPDIIVGWELQIGSWGYLRARGRHYGFDISDLISRAPAGRESSGADQWGLRHTSSLKVVGRHVFNLWRIMRAEQTLNMYSFENVVFNVLRRRVPQYNPSTLTKWYNSPDPTNTASIMRYFSTRTSINLEILHEAEIVTKTAEFARVFGVDFFSVISRGSQFKVESFMFRIAKAESFVLLSPSRKDVGKQNAAECMPLVMEPLSAFYNSPLVVLDFQSLYPSIMIAYNYCYSTCLGRIKDFKGQNKFGVTELHQPDGLLELLQDHIRIAPNGIMYVKPEVRKGLLGRMLQELLDTRVMVKQAMKSVKEDKMLKRILDARQLGLKYISNVTYGYTSATYSGRMPAVEIADSIVQSGRETLEKAIRIIDSTKKWGAKVVYGDTDSVFVYLRGKTKDQAFMIGHEIADTITALNPSPVKLKFEKVYLPCVLMAKKRYVGFKYENPDDHEAVFDAKGIETVRRDGVPAQQKMTENCLKIFFRTQDLSQVKHYCWRTWMQILENKVSVQDFIFAKEVRLGTYSDKIPPPPGAAVAARQMLQDENNEPQYGERVPYVIVRGEPNSRLVDRAVAPNELLDNRHKHLDTTYYISRVLIPPLERIFSLVGADIRHWFEEMPKTVKAQLFEFSSPQKTAHNVEIPDRINIDEHFLNSQCLVCGGLASEGICDDCSRKPPETLTGLLRHLQAGERRLRSVQQTCASCTARPPASRIECVSLDCPWLFERKKAEYGVDMLVVLLNEVNVMENCDIAAQYP